MSWGDLYGQMLRDAGRGLAQSLLIWAVILVAVGVGFLIAKGC